MTDINNKDLGTIIEAGKIIGLLDFKEEHDNMRLEISSRSTRTIEEVFEDWRSFFELDEHPPFGFDSPSIMGGAIDVPVEQLLSDFEIFLPKLRAYSQVLSIQNLIKRYEHHKEVYDLRRELIGRTVFSIFAQQHWRSKIVEVSENLLPYDQ